jgi:hypothetical protein
MAGLYVSGADPSRLYYGTDTHAQSILIGAALAALAVRAPITVRRPLATPAAVLAAGGLAWAACSLGSSNRLTYEGGFLAVSLLAGLLIAVVVAAPSSAAARALSLSPLAYIGRISYGMYLWYFPLFAVIDRASTGLAGANLFLVRCGADILIAAVSFHLVEQPVRGWRPRFGHRLPAGAATLATGAAAALVAGALVLVGPPTAYPGVPSASPFASAAQLPAPSGGAGMRLMVFGDSTAATLGDDLALAAARTHQMVVDVVGLFGCGLATSVAVSPHGQPTIPPPSCRAGAAPSEQWPAQLRAAIGRFRPAVVLVATGRWEVQSRRATPAGPWVNITQRGDTAYVRSQMEMAASIVIGSGSRLALATAPCFSSGEQPNGDAWPEDSPARVNAYNSIVRQVSTFEADAHPGQAAVVDLDAMVCPAGRFHTVLDDVTVRAPDGIHYPYFDIKRQSSPDPDTVPVSEAFGAWIAPKILRQLGPVAG